MKNFLVVVLVVFMVVMLGMSAHAAKLEFKEFAVHGFSIEVPGGWSATEVKSGNALDINSDGAIVINRIGGTELITFLSVNSEGMCSRTFADMVTGRLGGSVPVGSDNGDFEFSYYKDGAKIDVRTRQIGHLGIVMETMNGFNNILTMLQTLNL